MKLSDFLREARASKDLSKIDEIWIFNSVRQRDEVTLSADKFTTRRIYVIDKTGKLPFSFSQDDMPLAKVECHDVSIASFEGLPRTAYSVVMSNTGVKMTSFEGAPLHIVKEFDVDTLGVKSLSGLGRDFLLSAEFIRVPSLIKSSILGLMLVKGLKTIKKTGPSDAGLKAVAIIRKHLGGDLLECKEELLDQGFKEFAKL